MTIKRFKARSAAEALTLVKQELGENAVILHTRRLPGDQRATSSAGLVEVTVGVPGPDEGLPGSVDSGLQANRTTITPLAAGSEIAELRRELEALRETVRWLASSETVQKKSGAGSFEQALLSRGLAADLVHALAEDAGPAQAERGKWVEALASRLPTSGGLGHSRMGPCVIVLIGPTGVGKTTTLAKLAAQKKIFEDQRVGFITADTYRIAAIEQLRTFAEIADIPIEVVYAPSEVQAALRRFRYLDYVFVDTAGRSQRNEEHLADLMALVERLEPDEVHLVLSLTSHQRILEEVVHRFSCVPVTHFLFTKLDENDDTVPIANLVWKFGKPVSFITNGQCVPEDILVAEAHEIAENIVPKEP